MTSHVPVTSSAETTPGIFATDSATDAALPTSVWMRMYASTPTGAPFVRCCATLVGPAETPQQGDMLAPCNCRSRTARPPVSCLPASFAH